MIKRTSSAKLIPYLFASIAALLLVSAPAFGSVRITIVNGNAPGVGFNDPTPVTPVGGNMGTTIGEQRLIAFQFAANIWGNTLDSNSEVRILSTFEPLTCTATSAVLGSAGTINIFRDFPGTEFPNTWYHVALANKRAGGDLVPGSAHIRARFNSNLGNTGCLQGGGFYYGLDNAAPSNRTDLVTVLLHEFAHGLGFSNFVTLATGAKFLGRDDIYIKYVVDNSTAKRWTEMTDAERKASAVNARHVVWDGGNVVREIPNVLSPGTPVLTVNSPSNIATIYAVGTASFGPPLSSPGVTGNIVLANDGVTSDGAGGTVTDACSPLANASAVNGNIALVDRGLCGFTVKVKNAQNAGAIGVIVADNAAGNPPPGLGGTDNTITIPSVRITLTDGNKIKAALTNNTVNATLGVNLAVRAGADESGRALLNAPDPLQPGSSISHWDPIAFRNQLMEPAINSDLTHSVKPPEDLTLPQMRDIGWFADADGDGLPDGVDVSLPRFRATSTLTRDCASGDYFVNLTFANVGTSTANNVQLTKVTLGGVSASSTLPEFLNTLKPGDSATRTLRFPSAAGAPGARVVLLINGTQSTTFLGGSFSTGSSKVLPACVQ